MLVRVNASGWGVGDKLTSAQQNAIDINVTNALDKRAGQSDTLASLIAASGAGRIIPSTMAGVDADATYYADTGNQQVLIPSTLTTNRTYTLGAANAVLGDVVSFGCDPALAYVVVINDQAAVPVYVLGNSPSADGSAASFVWTGSAWQLLLGSHVGRPFTEFLSSGGIVVPRRVTLALAVGCGGGGGGGSGNQFTSAADRSPTGGGGGAGAPLTTWVIPVTPGSTLSAVIGAGGVGGVSASQSGSDGVASTLSDGVTTWRFTGGGGGAAGSKCDGAGVALWVPGGLPIAGWQVTNSEFTGTSANPPLFNVPEAAGGWGTSSNVSFGRAGSPSRNGFAGGSAGTHGSAAGTYRGGGGGGGGGGGPYFAANGGGGGGNGNNAGVGGNGNNGPPAQINSGAGGPGGGGSGMGTGGTGAYGQGGAGGSGRIQLFWVK